MRDSSLSSMTSPTDIELNGVTRWHQSIETAQQSPERFSWRAWLRDSDQVIPILIGIEEVLLMRRGGYRADLDGFLPCCTRFIIGPRVKGQETIAHLDRHRIALGFCFPQMCPIIAEGLQVISSRFATPLSGFPGTFSAGALLGRTDPRVIASRTYIGVTAVGLKHVLEAEEDMEVCRICPLGEGSRLHRECRNA